MQKNSDFDSLYPSRPGFFYLLWIAFLLIGPFVCAGYLGERLTWIGKDAGPALAFGLFLPASYLVIYAILRKLDAESRSFIIFIVLLYFSVGAVELWKAINTDDKRHWFNMAVAFSYLAIYGLVYGYMNRRQVSQKPHSPQ